MRKYGLVLLPDKQSPPMIMIMMVLIIMMNMMIMSSYFSHFHFLIGATFTFTLYYEILFNEWEVIAVIIDPLQNGLLSMLSHFPFSLSESLSFFSMDVIAVIIDPVSFYLSHSHFPFCNIVLWMKIHCCCYRPSVFLFESLSLSIVKIFPVIIDPFFFSHLSHFHFSPYESLSLPLWNIIQYMENLCCHYRSIVLLFESLSGVSPFRQSVCCHLRIVENWKHFQFSRENLSTNFAIILTDSNLSTKFIWIIFPGSSVKLKKSDDDGLVKWWIFLGLWFLFLRFWRQIQQVCFNPKKRNEFQPFLPQLVGLD